MEHQYTQETRTAAVESLKHWIEIWADPATAKLGAEQCALCRHSVRVSDEAGKCDVCPVKHMTGRGGCVGIGYVIASNAQDYWKEQLKHGTGPATDTARQAFVDAARHVVNNLIRVVEYIDAQLAKQVPIATPAKDAEASDKDPHAVVREAHAKGARIEFRIHAGYPWADAPDPSWNPKYEYRVVDPHREVKEAFGKGAKVEFSVDGGQTWGPASTPRWDPGVLYRVFDPHREAKEAHAAGAQIEWRSSADTPWHAANEPTWNPEFEYRVYDQHREAKEIFARGGLLECRSKGGEGKDGAWVRTTGPTWRPDKEYREYDPHREAKEIFARGGKIEFRRKGSNGAWSIAATPMWGPDMDYREHDPLRKIKEAYAAGYKVQWRLILKGSGSAWETVEPGIEPGWDVPDCEWRIAPRELSVNFYKDRICAHLSEDAAKIGAVGGSALQVAVPFREVLPE